jgi:hypothetical protein
MTQLPLPLTLPALVPVAAPVAPVALAAPVLRFGMDRAHTQAIFRASMRPAHR